MNLTYLFVNIGSILIPFIFSFHPKLQFHKFWRSTLTSIFLTSILFISWDIYFTELGVWGFNHQYITGIYFFNLPIEEILFFFCIPYSCLFTFHCLKALINPFNFINYKITTSILSFILLTAGVYFYPKYYTTTTFIALAIFLLVMLLGPKFKLFNRFYLTYLILLIPFFIINGILTGSGLNNPVVWYNENEIIGLRLLTIPIEDTFYGLFLILMNVVLFERFNQYFNTASFSIKP